MVTLYGIKNCDTMRKARRWLEGHGVEYRFHDYRKDGIDAARLRGWCGELGWETLLNRRGTTWRRLPEAQREGVDAARAIALMVEHPAMIKRPILDLGDRRVAGFAEDRYRDLFESSP
jgi:arsenate reductase